MECCLSPYSGDCDGVLWYADACPVRCCTLAAEELGILYNRHSAHIVHFVLRFSLQGLDFTQTVVW